MANWYCEIDGLEEVMQKIQKLQDLDAQQVLQDIAEEGKNVVQAETASAGFPQSSQETGIYNPTKNRIEVGFSDNFEAWKPLWYHHWSYRIHYKGRDGKTHFVGRNYVLHAGCWDNIRSIAIQQLAPILKSKMKRYIDQQLNK